MDVFQALVQVFGDKLLAFEETPKMDSGRILVPLRFLSESLGYNVDWDADTRTAHITTD